MFGIERVAALVDIAELHRLADADRAVIGLFLAGDHLEQRRLAGAVRADDADDAAGRQLERQVLDQQLVAKPLVEVFDLDDDIAQPLAMRNDDLRVGRPALVGCVQQFLEGLDTRLGLGLARLGAGRDPFALAADRALARVVLAAFLLEALGLGFEIGGVVALVGNAAAAVELEDPAGDVVEEVAIVGDDQHRALVGAQVLFQPGGGLGVEMVGRFVEQQQVGLGQQQLAQRDAAALAARQLGDVGILRRAAQRFHRHLDLLFEVPQVQAVHLVLELGRLVGRLVGIVHHQLVVALDDGGLLGDAFHDVLEHRLGRVELPAPAPDSRRSRLRRARLRRTIPCRARP